MITIAQDPLGCMVKLDGVSIGRIRTAYHGLSRKWQWFHSYSNDGFPDKKEAAKDLVRAIEASGIITRPRLADETDGRPTSAQLSIDALNETLANTSQPLPTTEFGGHTVTVSDGMPGEGVATAKGEQISRGRLAKMERPTLVDGASID